MNYDRLFLFFNIKLLKLKNKYLLFKQNLTITLILIFSSFFFGNLFATVLNQLRNYLNWDPLIFLFFIIVIEKLNSIIYSKTKNFNKLLFYFLKFLNSLKIGFLLGLFIDAFKVGS